MENLPQVGDIRIWLITREEVITAIKYDLNGEFANFAELGDEVLKLVSNT